MLGGTENYLYFSVLMKQAVKHGVSAYGLKSYKGIVCFPYEQSIQRANVLPDKFKLVEITVEDRLEAESELIQRCSGDYSRLVEYMVGLVPDPRS